MEDIERQVPGYSTAVSIVVYMHYKKLLRDTHACIYICSHRVMEILRELDPSGVQRRRSHRLHRRVYLSHVRQACLYTYQIICKVHNATATFTSVLGSQLLLAC